MKTPLCTAISLYFGLSSSLTAQNFYEPTGVVSDAGRPVVEASGVVREVPVIKVQASAPEAPAVYEAQDAITLEPRMARSQVVDSVVDLSVLKKVSPFRDLAAGRPVAAAEVEADGIKQDLALISATYRESGRRESDCQSLALSVEQRVKLDHSDVLEIVEREMKSNPSCSCEIVKAAIQAADADPALVVAIVEMAITANPESMRVASQCAIASAPESLTDVQALLSRYDANAGESGESAKSAKGAKAAVASAEMPDTVAAMPNPLDFPGKGPIGAAPGGQPYLNPMPPVVVTPPVTEVSP
jgi:hypothetical protein